MEQQRLFQILELDGTLRNDNIYEMVKIIWYWMGRIEGCIPPDNRNILPPYVPIATQIPQAAGAAWASKYKNESACSLVYFGDGATSDHV
ncbi:thiamine pyrophosphate-dependent enzyme [Paenibacillus sp. B1-33]|uniref:thiamine pyrophosphate-dependent enzyme n=1 Tax=unclassified Paenibacillus TaxID=185978 RepID=UPI003D2DD701